MVVSSPLPDHHSEQILRHIKLAPRRENQKKKRKGNKRPVAEAVAAVAAVAALPPQLIGFRLSSLLLLIIDQVKGKSNGLP